MPGHDLFGAVFSIWKVQPIPLINAKYAKTPRTTRTRLSGVPGVQPVENRLIIAPQSRQGEGGRAPFSVQSSRLATAVGLVALCALGIWYGNKTPAVVPRDAADRFSAERAFVHVQQIAQRPHPPGTPDHARVREYLLAELRRIGLTPEVQATTGVGTRYAVAGRVHNVLARIPGTTPGGRAVLLMSHYDGVWAGPSTADAASGTAALLDVARLLRNERHAHDVILLLADGEESGLLGAAAFAREHPWAKEVGVVLNFEARGVNGVSRMFETGPGNLDVARELRKMPGVRATSLSVTVYRLLPNDTDLSEMAVLNTPAMNFAFIGGVQRYHTAEDDLAHLGLGSLQHHGEQALALARAFADGPLPRPATGDAAFFDFPLVGLIVYPIGWSLPIALAGAGLLVAAMVMARKRHERWWRGLGIGAATFVVSLVVALIVSLCVSYGVSRVHATIGGAPEWSATYGAGYAFLCVAAVLASWFFARRFASALTLYLGGLVVPAVLTVLLALRVPGVSFLFAWPLLFASGAALVGAASGARPARIVGWVAAAVTLIMLAPTIHAMVIVALGLDQTGTALLAVLSAVALWLVALLLDDLGQAPSWRPALVAAAVGAVLLVAGLLTVRTNASRPAGSTFAYVIDADSLRAWLAGSGTTPAVRAWVRDELAVATPDARVPAWLTRSFEPRRIKPAPVGAFVAPVVTLMSDSATATGRIVTLLVRPDTGTLAVSLSADGGAIAAASVDGRAIDRSRYRSRSTRWSLDYIAPGDSGFTLRLELPPGSKPALQVLARRPGIPALSGLTLPTRPEGVLPINSGDQSIVYKRVQL